MNGSVPHDPSCDGWAHLTNTCWCSTGGIETIRAALDQAYAAEREAQERIKELTVLLIGRGQQPPFPERRWISR